VVLPLGKQSWANQHWNAPGSAVHSRTTEVRMASSLGRPIPHRACPQIRQGDTAESPKKLKRAGSPLQDLKGPGQEDKRCGRL
jgi:hypothetical protein